MQYQTTLFHLIDGDKVIYILVYVDDIHMRGNQPKVIDNLIEKSNKNFSLKILRSLSYSFITEVKRDCEGMHLSQSKSILDLLRKTNMP